MKLTFDEWHGEAPKFHPEQLAPGMAVMAVNTKPGRGILEAWQAPLLQTDIINGVPQGSPSMFLYEPTGLQAVWVHDIVDVEWTTPAIPNDEFRFLIRTDEDYPKFATFDSFASVAPYQPTYLRLGMGYPDEAQPQVTVYLNDADRETNPLWGDIVAQGSEDMPIWDAEWEEDLDDLDTTSTEYKITFVDAYGRESAGSIPSSRIEITIYQNTLKEFPVIQLPPAWIGDYPEVEESYFRIYRSNTGTLGATFQFLTDVPMTRGGTDWADGTLSSDLGEAIVTDSWIGPPDDDTELYPNGPMRGILAHPAGFLVGHTKHEIVFGEPYTVHAFPSVYRQSFSEEIVGIVRNGNDIFIGTSGTPMIMTGVHPRGMSPIRLAEPFPAVSMDGMTEVNGRVFFVSDTGLIAVSGHTGENVSQAYILENAWKALEPETMRLSNYDGRLFIFTVNHGTFVYNPDAPQEGFRRNEMDVEAYFVLPKDGVLAYREPDEDEDDILLFARDVDNRQDYHYESRVFKNLSAVSFNVCKVFANSYPVGFTLHGEAENGYEVSETIIATSESWFYLSSVPRCERWWITASGDDEIRSVELATNAQELN